MDQLGLLFHLLLVDPMTNVLVALARLFGGKTFGVGFNRIRPVLGFGPFDRCENTIKEPVAVALDHFCNPPYIDDVRAQPDNHARAFFRPRSMAARMNFIVSARPSKTDSPMIKWPMLSSTICGSEAIVSALA